MNTSQPDRTYLYEINAQEFASSDNTQTPQQLKAQAGIEPTHVVFRVDQNAPGEQLDDATPISLSGSQVERFYAIPREDAQERPHFKFNVDGQRYESLRPDVTGADIKLMAGVPANALLFQEGRTSADQRIEDSTHVNLARPGTESFYTSLPANNGSVDAPVRGPLDTQFAALQQIYPNAELTHQPDGTAWVRVPGIPLTPAWTEPQATVKFVVPNGYPASPLDCFWVEPPLTLRNGASPANTGHNALFPQDLWFSYHVQGWSPTENSLLTYVGVIRQRLNAGN
ncbi:multiubiquitin domain-containing protein [Deinococcus antarcticus]|uniref:Multiubiquitin domain-containing protein n=1 Tax=Deinococcus antarcticus TaxID=1298767 RepID=A0ABV8A7E7_9DEIO